MESETKEKRKKNNLYNRHELIVYSWKKLVEKKGVNKWVDQTSLD